MIGGVENEFIRNNYYDKFVIYFFGGFNNVFELIIDGLNILNIVGSSYRVKILMFFFSFGLFLIK